MSAPITPVVGPAFTFAVVATLLSIGVVFPRISPAAKSDYPDIVAFQQSGWGGAAGSTAILDRWRADDRIETAKQNTYFDFAFPIFYSSALFFGVRIAADGFRRRDQFRWSALGRLFSWMQPLAGLCDWIENAFILILLNAETVVGLHAYTMSAFATMKVLLCSVGLTYIVVNWCESLRR